MPQGVYGAESGYFENPDNIYEQFKSQIYNTSFKVEYAFIKEGATLYRDHYGSKKIGKVKKYSGIIVVSKTQSYVQVIYKSKKNYKIGWMKKERYKDITYFYNGAEKQLVADGRYEIENKSSGENIDIDLKFQGNQKYQIKAVDDKIGTKTGSWQLIREYDHFYIKNTVTGSYLAADDDNQLKLRKVDGVIENQFAYEKSQAGPSDCQWKLRRIEDKNVNPYRNFLQYDPAWAANDYGNVQDYSGKMAAAGCGVLAVTNAVYALNGQFIDPMILAEYAVKKEYRIIGSGTDDGIFSAAASEYGDAYGFYYVEKTSSTLRMQNYLKKGCVAISHVPGHYVTVADYNEKTKKYLVLDSHPIASRPTNPFGNWFKRQRLETGGLTSSGYYIFSSVKDMEAYSKVQNILFMGDFYKVMALFLF